MRIYKKNKIKEITTKQKKQSKIKIQKKEEEAK